VEIGRFEETLLPALHKLGHADFVFMDGNHQKLPTLEYFRQIKPFLSENSVVILDDIYWSKGMAEAWELLKDDAQVTLSLDLFHQSSKIAPYFLKNRTRFIRISYLKVYGRNKNSSPRRKIPKGRSEDYPWCYKIARPL